jgi:hypothetical protein
LYQSTVIRIYQKNSVESHVFYSVVFGDFIILQISKIHQSKRYTDNISDGLKWLYSEVDTSNAKERIER